MSGIERRLRRGDWSGFALLNVKFGPVFLAMQAAISGWFFCDAGCHSCKGQCAREIGLFGLIQGFETTKPEYDGTKVAYMRTTAWW